MTQREGLLNRSWEQTQIKVFGRWVNKYLQERGLGCEDLTTELSDGVKLINMLEVVGKEPIGGRYHKKPTMRIQMLENCNLAIKYITEVKKVKLVGIGSDDIVDKNLKLTLGMIWSVINKFQIEDISVEEATARDALLIWCKKNTAGYDGVSISNFTSSWSSGLGFCALINHFRPELLDYNALDKADHTSNCINAFEACKKLGITVFLDPEDLVGITPDEKSVVTQCSEFFHYFASESKNDAMADKLKKIISIQRQINDLHNCYASEAQKAMDMMNESEANVTSTQYEKTVPGTKAKLVEVIKYGQVQRPEIVDQKGVALKAWAGLVTKCKSNSCPLPVPPKGLEPEALGARLDSLDGVASQTRKSITSELKSIQESLVNKFDQLCKGVVDQCYAIKEKATQLSGTFAAQKGSLQGFLQETKTLESNIAELQQPYNELVEYKLNFRAKNSMISIQSVVDQTEAHLNHLLNNIEALIIEEGRQTKIDSFNALSESKVAQARELEASLNTIEGSLEDRRAAFLSKKSEIESKKSVEELLPLYEELEREELHLEIEHTPISITALFEGLLSLVATHIGEIDAGIAAAKGLEVSQEQMEEFRETFSHFDKDHSGTLQYYEIKACLTALGDTSTDDECKEIARKYSEGQEEINFDGYVKFMLDRFSKAYTADTTKEAFKALSGNNPVISEQQLGRYFSPEDVEYLKAHMPKVENGYDFSNWAESIYIQ